MDEPVTCSGQLRMNRKRVYLYLQYSWHIAGWRHWSRTQTGLLVCWAEPSWNYGIHPAAKTERKRENLICKRSKTEEKKGKAMEWMEEKLGLFFSEWLSKLLCEMKLFSCLMCWIITPLTLSIILIQSKETCRDFKCLPSSHMHTHTKLLLIDRWDLRHISSLWGIKLHEAHLMTK